MRRKNQFRQRREGKKRTWQIVNGKAHGRGKEKKVRRWLIRSFENRQARRKGEEKHWRKQTTALIELLDYTPAGAASFMPISALVSGKRHIVSRENRPRCYFPLYLVILCVVRVCVYTAAETFDLFDRCALVTCLTDFIKKTHRKQTGKGGKRKYVKSLPSGEFQ